MKYLILFLSSMIAGASAFAIEYNFPPEMAKAEVCEVRNVHSLTCVDADGIQILETDVLKSNGFFDTEPKYSMLSTIAMMRKLGFELRSDLNGNSSTSYYIFVRAR